MTKRKSPSLFTPDQEGSYFSILFQPLSDPCWILREKGNLLGDVLGEPLAGEVLFRLAHQKPMTMLLVSVSLDHSRYTFSPNHFEDDEDAIQVISDHILSANEIPTPRISLEGVSEELVLLPNGGVSVGCHTLTPLDVRRVFAVLADHFEYELPGWKTEPKPEPVKKRGRGRL